MTEPQKKSMDVCPYCAHERKFPLYVFAHWDEALDTTCEQCGKAYTVRRGYALKSGKAQP